MHPGVYRLLLRFTRLVALATLAATLGGLLSKHGLIFELLCHFRVQYFLCALVVAIAFARFRHWGWLLLSLTAATVNGAMILPWYLGNDQRHTDETASITLLQSNIYAGNGNLAKLSDLVDIEQPDLLLVQELNAQGESQLNSLSASLPYSVTVPREDNFGLGLYSKWPLMEQEILRFGEMGLPAVSARIDVTGYSVEVLVVHPPPPIGKALYRERNVYLQDLAEYVAGLPGPVIVAGDLNSSMWSDHYQLLEKKAGLRNARAGFGVLPTWPAGLGSMGIPIDHCLVSQDIAVVELRVGPNVGSDHLPMIVELDLASNKI